MSWLTTHIVRQPNTLLRYLLDELARYENDHSDALCPIQNHPEQSFNGEGVLLGPVTTLEHRELQTAIERKIDGLGTLFLGAMSIVGQPRSAQHPASPMPSLMPGPSPISYSCPAPLNLFINQTSTPPATPTAVGANNKARKALPLRGIKIPDLPAGGWRVAVSQWEAPDAATLAAMGGICLKDWPDDWYKGINKTTYGVKRGQREIIARGYAE